MQRDSAVSPLGRPRDESPEGGWRRQTKDKEETIALTSREQSFFFFLKCNYDLIIQIPTSGIPRRETPSATLGNGVLIGQNFFPVHRQIARRFGGSRGRQRADLSVELSSEKPQGFRPPVRPLPSPAENTPRTHLS